MEFCRKHSFEDWRFGIGRCRFGLRLLPLHLKPFKCTFFGICSPSS